jgi:hypothetical protein
VRYIKGHAQAQKREEREMFRCYYEAIEHVRMDSHRTNLNLVRENLIYGPNDLTIKVFENFLNVCGEMCVDVLPLIDVLKFHPIHPGKGNGYKIPSQKKYPIEHAKARAIRTNWRREFRIEFETAGIDILIHEDIQTRMSKLRVINGGVR